MRRDHVQAVTSERVLLDFRDLRMLARAEPAMPTCCRSGEGDSLTASGETTRPGTGFVPHLQTLEDAGPCGEEEGGHAVSVSRGRVCRLPPVVGTRQSEGTVAPDSGAVTSSRRCSPRRTPRLRTPILHIRGRGEVVVRFDQHWEMPLDQRSITPAQHQMWANRGQTAQPVAPE